MTDEELRTQLTRHTVLLESIAEQMTDVRGVQIQQGKDMAVLTEHVEEIAPKVHSLEQDKAKMKGVIAGVSTVVSLIWACILGWVQTQE